MEDTHVGFIKGSITYVGTPDSVKIYPGNKRMKMTWRLSDPSATLAKVYWNNKSDSLVVPVKLAAGSDLMELMFDNMKEGTYSFDILMFDNKNNRSVSKNVVGRVYGDTYVNTLLGRPVKQAVFDKEKVTVSWGIADQTAIAAEISYRDKSGTRLSVRVPPDSMTTTLKNYSMSLYGTFEYRTLYAPDSLSLDIFSTASQTVKVTGPPIEYTRTGWTGGLEDYDIPTGRVPQNLLDNNINTIWHMDKNKSYPHPVTIDMKTVNTVNGLTYNQREPLDGAVKLVEIQVSSDNLTWRSLGAYTFENLRGKQYLELLEPAAFRYFKVIVRSDYKNGSASALAELGAYRR
ncbi:DUF4998 domain-containing protein [Pedobacter yulinensis]|nr:DUF4998 domain-containing protein [Pedobacter yulinensis]